MAMNHENKVEIINSLKTPQIETMPQEGPSVVLGTESHSTIPSIRIDSPGDGWVINLGSNRRLSIEIGHRQVVSSSVITNMESQTSVVPPVGVAIAAGDMENKTTVPPVDNAGVARVENSQTTDQVATATVMGNAEEKTTGPPVDAGVARVEGKLTPESLLVGVTAVGNIEEKATGAPIDVARVVDSGQTSTSLVGETVAIGDVEKKTTVPSPIDNASVVREVESKPMAPPVGVEPSINDGMQRETNTPVVVVGESVARDIESQTVIPPPVDASEIIRNYLDSQTRVGFGDGRGRKDDKLEGFKKGLLLLRVSTLIFSFLALVITATNKHGDWKDFEEYAEYKYVLAIAIVSSLYAGLQAFIQFKYSGREFISRQNKKMLDFFGDQLLSYLLLSAASSALPLTIRMREEMSMFTDTKEKIFINSSVAAISFELLAFFTLAVPALFSAYKLCNQS